MSLRDIILAAPLKRERVEVPEWAAADGAPTAVYVSTMSGTTRAAWNDAAFDADGKAIEAHVRPRLLVHCLTDEAGAPIFTTDDIAALDRAADDVLSRLFTIAKRINGIGQNAVDGAEKNSSAGVSGGSTSSSPSPSA